MANTVNGQNVSSSAGVPVANRIMTGIQMPGIFAEMQRGEVLQAIIVLDGTGGNVIIDDPTASDTAWDNGRPHLNDRLFIVGLAYSDANADTVTLISKVGSTLRPILVPPLNTNQGILLPINGNVIFMGTDIGGALVMAVTLPCTLTLHYVLAPQCRLAT